MLLATFPSIVTLVYALFEPCLTIRIPLDLKKAIASKKLKWHDVLTQNVDDEIIDELYMLLKDIKYLVEQKEMYSIPNNERQPK